MHGSQIHCVYQEMTNTDMLIAGVAAWHWQLLHERCPCMLTRLLLHT